MGSSHTTNVRSLACWLYEFVFLIGICFFYLFWPEALWNSCIRQRTIMVVGLDHESSDAREGPGGQCVSCFHVNKGSETTTAAYAGIARMNVLVYSCLKLFLLLALSLPSLKNHRGFRSSLRSFSLLSRVLRESQETKVYEDHSRSATSSRKGWRCLAKREETSALLHLLLVVSVVLKQEWLSAVHTVFLKHLGQHVTLARGKLSIGGHPWQLSALCWKALCRALCPRARFTRPPCHTVTLGLDCSACPKQHLPDYVDLTPELDEQYLAFHNIGTLLLLYPVGTEPRRKARFSRTSWTACSSILRWVPAT